MIAPPFLVRAGRLLLVAWLAAVATGCVLTPRVPADVSVAFNRHNVRVLHTQHIDLYYPEPFAAEAARLAERAEGCVEALRARKVGRGGLSETRIELLFPDLPYNNAYVNPPINGDFFSLIPTHWTADLMAETGLVPDPGFIACHELTHYVHAQQTLRSLGGLNRAFGPLITPQLGLDPWFWEGLATHYEEALQRKQGRPTWPAWDGLFHAAVTKKPLSGGDLSELNRRVSWGNHYVYGSHFVRYLIETYGEPKIWELVARQGRSFFFPFIVNQRFKRVYGKRLSQLIDEFSEHVAARYPARRRPEAQRIVREVGQNGRYARATDGTEALLSEAMDAPPTLTVRAASGSLLYQERLTDVLPRRKLVSPSSVMVSGLRFSRDGRALYFVAVDLGRVFQEARLMRLDVARGDLTVVRDDLRGLGGDIAIDQQSYYYVAVSGHGHTLAQLDLATGASRPLYRAPPGVYLSSPTLSPDGTKIVASLFEGAYGLALFDARDGARLSTISVPGSPVSDATFVDDDRLLLLGAHEGRFQAFVYALSTKEVTRITDAPYLVMAPRAAQGTVRFMNREGLRYTLDEVALPPARAVQATRTAPVFLADVGDAGVSPPPAEPLSADAFVPSVGDAGTPSGQGSAPILEFGLDGGAPEVPRALAIVEGPIVPPAAPRAAPLTRREDEPYAVFPRLLIPSLRTPYGGFGSTGAQSIFGYYLGGTDALGKHRWGTSLGVQLFTWELSGSVGYLNAQLAPLFLSVQASQLAYDAGKREADEDHPLGRIVEHDRNRQRDLTVAATLPLRTSVFALAFHATEDFRPDRASGQHRRALGGGTLALTHAALESTPMSGPRRGFRALVSGSYYPDRLGTLPSDMFDLRGALGLYSPLPFSERHTLNLTVRARAMLHDPSERLLEVGGTQLGTLFDHPDEPDFTGYPGLPPKRRFQEPLRGFETFPFAVDRIGIADLTYRYPIIIDRGTATSFSILPAFFLRQIDLEAFASAASDAFTALERRGHLAAGGALTVHFVWLLPLSFQYQLSKRLSDDEERQHLLSLGVPMAP